MTFGPKSSSLSVDLVDPCDLGLCKGEVAMETLSCCEGLRGDVLAETLLLISKCSSGIQRIRILKESNVISDVL